LFWQNGQRHCSVSFKQNDILGFEVDFSNNTTTILQNGTKLHDHVFHCSIDSLYACITAKTGVIGVCFGPDVSGKDFKYPPAWLKPISIPSVQKSHSSVEDKAGSHVPSAYSSLADFVCVQSSDIFLDQLSNSVSIGSLEVLIGSSADSSDSAKRHELFSQLSDAISSACETNATTRKKIGSWCSKLVAIDNLPSQVHRLVLTLCGLFVHKREPFSTSMDPSATPILFEISTTNSAPSGPLSSQPSAFSSGSVPSLFGSSQSFSAGLFGASTSAAGSGQLFNISGVVMTRSSQTGLLYCGRNLGRNVIPGSDGFCGPNNGPQCSDCKFAVASVSSSSSAPSSFPSLSAAFCSTSVTAPLAPALSALPLFGATFAAPVSAAASGLPFGSGGLSTGAAFAPGPAFFSGAASAAASVSNPFFSAASTVALKVGDRIRRGKDWKWGQQDNKSSDPKSGRGTVVSIGDWISVKWDHGATNSYRHSAKHGYDIELDSPSSTDAPALPTMPTVPIAKASSFQPLFPLFLREIFLQGLSAADTSIEAWSTFCLKFEKMLCPPGFALNSSFFELFHSIKNQAICSAFFELSQAKCDALMHSLSSQMRCLFQFISNNPNDKQVSSDVIAKALQLLKDYGRQPRVHSCDALCDPTLPTPPPPPPVLIYFCLLQF
jgi:hypothetical protein